MGRTARRRRTFACFLVGWSLEFNPLFDAISPDFASLLPHCHTFRIVTVSAEPLYARGRVPPGIGGPYTDLWPVARPDRPPHGRGGLFRIHHVPDFWFAQSAN